MKGNPISRRRYLAGAAGLLATAGCLGEQSGGDSGPTTVNEPSGAEVSELDGTDVAPPATTVSSLPTPVRGDPDADVTVTAYEDFACPHCREYALSVEPELVEAFIEPEEIRYERRDFPIPVHETWSWVAADAARAVQADAGDDAFWEYSHLLYENQGSYSFDLFPDLAEEVDADSEMVRTGVEGEVYRPVVEADRERGRERGVTGTPTVFVNGRSVGSEFESIRQAVESELDSSG